MDPWSRAKKLEEELAKKDEKELPKLRTCIDLIRLAGLDEAEVNIKTTLHDLKQTYDNANPQKKDDGRTKLLARLKESGVTSLTARQKLASTMSMAKREFRLKPVKDEEGHGDEEAEANGAATSEFPKPLTKAEKAVQATMTIAPLPAEVFEFCCNGTTKMVNAWLNNGGNVDAREEVFKATLLMGAALHGHLEIVDLLLRKGANIDLQHGQGGTALLNAAGSRHFAICERLLQEGANAELKNIYGLGAYEFAVNGQHGAIVALLRAHLKLPAFSEEDMSAALAAAAAAAAPVPKPIPDQLLESGTRVRVNAMVSRPDLNGRPGTVVSYDQIKCCYHVDVAGESVGLKPNHIAVERAPSTTAVTTGRPPPAAAATGHAEYNTGGFFDMRPEAAAPAPELSPEEQVEKDKKAAEKAEKGRVEEERKATWREEMAKTQAEEAAKRQAAKDKAREEAAALAKERAERRAAEAADAEQAMANYSSIDKAKAKVTGEAAAHDRAKPSAPSTPATDAPAEGPKLRNGERVLISGLAGRPELNGRCGLVQSFLPDKGRYHVQVELLNETVALKEQNLARAPVVEVD